MDVGVQNTASITLASGLVRLSQLSDWDEPERHFQKAY